jgi:hypothetical protein
MTLEEVASYLKLKPQTIYTWAQDKEWRFKKSIIDEWILHHIDERFDKIIENWKKKQKED